MSMCDGGFRRRRVLALACLLTQFVSPRILGAAPPFGAAPQWVRARLGSFETVSDNGRPSAIQGLSQFEQFRFALGSAMGQSDLRLDPPLRILVFRNAPEMASHDCAGFLTGRDRQMTCTTAEGQLPTPLIRELTRQLLQSNFASLPEPVERALESFFSTVQSNAVHVTWGAPPPPPERTRDWALLHRLITQPDYSGRAHIYLHNLANGMDTNGAIRSLSEDPAKFNAEVDRYFAAGVFSSTQAPNLPLNPERDFHTTILTTDEGELMRADMLGPGAAEIYRGLLKARKHEPEAHEGLAVLAMRSGDADQARVHMDAARKAGTHNVVALTAFGSLEKDPEQAALILKEALTLDPKYAPAHWALGEKLPEAPRRMMEWKQAVALAPRNFAWWTQYAKLCQDQKQYAEAGRAWLAAAQSAPDAPAREQALTARGLIDQLRLDDEYEIRRRDAAAKAAEIDRLKNQARRDLAELEARANTRPLSKDEAAKVVDWADVNKEGATLTGTLTRVECNGKRLILTVKDSAAKIRRLSVGDISTVGIKGGDGTLTCGVQKPRPVAITYVPITYNAAVDKSKDVFGEVTGIELR